MNEPTACLIPNCNKSSMVRGLCYSHYQYVAKLVRNGKHTWADLVSKGKVLGARGKGEANIADYLSK